MFCVAFTDALNCLLVINELAKVKASPIKGNTSFLKSVLSKKVELIEYPICSKAASRIALIYTDGFISSTTAPDTFFHVP